MSKCKKPKNYPEISLKPEQIDSEIVFDKIFGRNAPLHIVIGSGKGTFLLNEAWFKPDFNFLGIERANKYYLHSVDRMGRWGIKNVRIIRTDAAEFIREYLPDEYVDCFHIYFPDPWPKKRHHKRRFLNTTNFSQLLRTLKSKGVIKIATDHSDYFKQIVKVIDGLSNNIEKIEFLPAATAQNDELVGTNYERKFKHQKKIHCIAVRKISTPDNC